jgi:hypothetical protein
VSDVTAQEYGKPRYVSLQSALCFLPCFLVSLIGTYLADYILLNLDMAAILKVAQQVAHGKRLYIDVITSQFPLIIYMAMIPLGLHSITGIPLPLAFFLCVFLLLQASVLLSWRIAWRSRVWSSMGQRYALLFALYFGLFIVPNEGEVFIGSFGQREHLFCAMILPYIMLSINRLQGVEGSRGEQIAAGILGAFGFCIKPHFALIFVLSEFFVTICRRRLPSWSRLDLRLIVTLSTIYYLLFLILMPAYIALIPRFIEFYRGYAAPRHEIFYQAQLMIIPPLLVALSRRWYPNFRIILYLLTIIGGATVIFIVQKLPFYYHTIPVYFFSLILFVSVVLASRDAVSTVLILPGIAYYIMATSSWPDIRGMEMRREEILKEAAIIAPYKKVIFLNSEPSPFTAICHADVEWGMTLAFLDYLPVTYHQWIGTYKEPPYHLPQEMVENERFFHEKVIKDLQQLPDAVIVDESPVKFGFPAMKFDYLHYFMLDPRFRDVWSHYELVSRITNPYEGGRQIGDSSFAIYRKKN